jgi:CRISPR-associated protein Cas1
MPARMVNEFVYCPRLAYLEWVQGEFEESADTAEGRSQHRVVDQEKGNLPAPEAEGEAGEMIHARSVWLSAPEEQLTARIDLLEGESTGAETALTPVDYKHGSVPDTPLHAWETDCVQLCAQGLVLRANGYACREGVLYYSESKTRVSVTFDAALETRTRVAVRAARAMAAAGIIPPPLIDSPKCVRCSLAPICLPDETNTLSPAPKVDRSDDTEERVRRLMPARDDALPLYVQEQGARISKSGDVFEAWLKDKKLGQSRIFETSHIALLGNVQITTQAMAAALDNGVPVAFFSMGGWFRGLAHGPAHKNVTLRLAQYTTALAPDPSLALARGFVAAKIRNCRTLLMRNHVNLPAEVPGVMAELAGDALHAISAEQLLGIEAQAAKRYFEEFPGMLKVRSEPDEWPFDFNGRNRRPPRDPVNALLSFAYSLLAKDLAVLAQVIGFDPFLGFYHRPRYGRPSLALDMMEEFRPLIADSVVITVINNGMLGAKDFIRRGPMTALTPTGRKKFLQAYESRLDTLITHPVFGYRVSYRRVLEVQLRLLGRLLSGELAEYPGFVTR